MEWVARHADWVLGCADETWWDRLATPSMSAWGDHPLRLTKHSIADKYTPQRSLACYGMLVRGPRLAPEVWVRLAGRSPVSRLTCQFLAWCIERLAQRGMRVLALVWDRATWHRSREVQGWIRTHNRRVKQTGAGTRILMLALPTQSPWLNPIEPCWVHAKRRVVDPAGPLAVEDITARIYDTFGCPHLPLLTLSDYVS